MTLNKALGQTLKRAKYITQRPFFPTASSIWHFSDALHLTTSLLQLLKSIDSA
jgi:hypothetical protein